MYFHAVNLLLDEAVANGTSLLAKAMVSSKDTYLQIFIK
jgi:hypothetical protein